jgi:microcystin-dependent protein
VSEPFLSEIKIVSFNFPPKGWALCNGQLLPINQNQALFALLGTTYGGNGQTTFALPNLRGRAPMHVGAHTLGEAGGEEAHTVTMGELPAHTHLVNASDANATTGNPAGNVPARATTPMYRAPTALTSLHPLSVSNVGGSQPHENMQPFLVLSFIIALQGIFPSTN